MSDFFRDSPEIRFTRNERSGKANGAQAFAYAPLLLMMHLRRQIISAEGGTRTPTGLHPLAPEASASTSSTTSARNFLNLGMADVEVKHPLYFCDGHGEGDR